MPRTRGLSLSNKKRGNFMEKKILPAQRAGGSVRLPGDKSISHRYAMLGAIAEGTSKLHNFSSGADCHSTLACVEGLGAKVRKLEPATVEIEGRGLMGLQAPAADLDAGNSGSTIRMLSGILAAQTFDTPDRWRRVAVAAADGPHHRAAVEDGGEDRGDQRQVPAARDCRHGGSRPSTTRCRWPAPR